MRTIDLIGQKFGMLIVREMLPGSKCRCDCDCGVKGFTTWRYSVRKGLTTSCGCHLRELLETGEMRRTHGESVAGKWTAEYRAWVNMITRCYNPNATRYKNWGGRGITVCDEWRNDYSAFLAAVGRRPSPKHSLDRHPNPDGNYEPGNVRWATSEEQSRNQRRCRLITAFGKTLTLIEWAESTGLYQSALLDRLNSGWPVEKALTTPSRGFRGTRGIRH